MKWNCAGCGKEMSRTPVCVNCGKIPIAEASFQRLESAIREAREIITRYRSDTPLGYQPHMLAGKADHWLMAYENDGRDA